ncbi:MAG: glycosyltransferase family 4 protein [Armatimonadota bacterium]|nr:glycosyltransferase family 4 protein [Armatimonadota bacterium]
MVVFHSVHAARRYVRETRGSGTQKILVQLHAPVDVATEEVGFMVDVYGPGQVLERLRRSTQDVELDTYKQVDGLVVPCIEAIDDYFLDVESHRKVLLTLPIFEVPSGAIPLRQTVPASAIRASMGVGAGQFLVAFFGRYHRHKGFDIFTKLAVAAGLRQPGRFRFFSAGLGPIAPPRAAGYQDLGWVSDRLGDYIGAADCVVAPNRHTFFDLAVLEAMSLGKLVITSATGGNKWLARLTEGIILVNEHEPEAYLSRLLQLEHRELAKHLGEANRRAYELHFSPAPFASRHVRFAAAALANC